MDAEHAKSVRPIIGPHGLLTRENLPSPQTERWVARRKAEIVAATEGGLLSFDEACECYALSREELLAWCVAYKRNGLNGLRASRAKDSSSTVMLSAIK
jgi:Protein of unknown function (DUF1153)